MISVTFAVLVVLISSIAMAATNTTQCLSDLGAFTQLQYISPTISIESMKREKDEGREVEEGEEKRRGKETVMMFTHFFIVLVSSGLVPNDFGNYDVCQEIGKEIAQVEQRRRDEEGARYRKIDGSGDRGRVLREH